MPKILKKIPFWIGLIILAGGACAAPPEPYRYETRRELKPGPGLFSGPDGVFTLPAGADKPDDQTETPAQSSAAEPSP